MPRHATSPLRPPWGSVDKRERPLDTTPEKTGLLGANGKKLMKTIRNRNRSPREAAVSWRRIEGCPLGENRQSLGKEGVHWPNIPALRRFGSRSERTDGLLVGCWSWRELAASDPRRNRSGV